MTTYTVVIDNDETEKMPYRTVKTTSIRKAKQICDEATTQANVVRFVKYNEPMPLVYWNDKFEEYVKSRGKTPVVDMINW